VDARLRYKWSVSRRSPVPPEEGSPGPPFSCGRAQWFEGKSGPNLTNFKGTFCGPLPRKRKLVKEELAGDTTSYHLEKSKNQDHSERRQDLDSLPGKAAFLSWVSQHQTCKYNNIVKI